MMPAAQYGIARFCEVAEMAGLVRRFVLGAAWLALHRVRLDGGAASRRKLYLKHHLVDVVDLGQTDRTLCMLLFSAASPMPARPPVTGRASWSTGRRLFLEVR